MGLEKTEIKKSDTIPLWLATIISKLRESGVEV